MASVTSTQAQEQAKAFLCSGYRVDKGAMTLISDTMKLFKINPGEFTFKEKPIFKNSLSIAENSESYSQNVAAGFQVSGNYGAFAAAAEASLHKLSSESSRTMHVNHDLYHIQYHISSDLLDYTKHLEPEVVKFVGAKTPKEIVTRLGHFFAQQIKFGGLMRVSREIHVNSSDSKESIYSKVSASYGASLAASISGSAEFESETAKIMGNRKESHEMNVMGGDLKHWLAFDNSASGTGSQKACQVAWAQSIQPGEMYPLEMDLIPIWKAFEDHPSLGVKAKEIQKYLETNWKKDLAKVHAAIEKELPAKPKPHNSQRGDFKNTAFVNWDDKKYGGRYFECVYKERDAIWYVTCFDGDKGKFPGHAVFPLVQFSGEIGSRCIAYYDKRKYASRGVVKEIFVDSYKVLFDDGYVKTLGNNDVYGYLEAEKPKPHKSQRGDCQNTAFVHWDNTVLNGGRYFECKYKKRNDNTFFVTCCDGDNGEFQSYSVFPLVQWSGPIGTRCIAYYDDRAYACRGVVADIFVDSYKVLFEDGYVKTLGTNDVYGYRSI